MLRWSCRGLTGASKRYLFASISFNWSKRHYCDQLKALASGRSPNSQRTTQLHIPALVSGSTDSEEGSRGRRSGQDLAEQLNVYEHESKYLVPAVLALENLMHVRYVFHLTWLSVVNELTNAA
jgi:hypothetical protein